MSRTIDLSATWRKMVWLVLLCLCLDPRGQAQVNTPSSAKVDGKNLVVRIYARERKAPAAFEGLALPISHGGVDIPKTKIPPESVLLVCAADQNNPDVVRALAGRIYILAPIAHWNLPRPPDDNLPRSFPLVDALGQPMPAEGLTATIVLREADPLLPEYALASQIENAWRIPLDRLASGPKGQPCLPMMEFVADGENPPAQNAKQPLFWGTLISHPAYGTALASREIFEMPQIRLPLVKAESPAATRALTGQIFTPENQPIPEAVVECGMVVTPGEGTIHGGESFVISDAEGRFRFYYANPQRNYVLPSTGELIPPHARYHFQVTAPASMGLLRYSGSHENGAPARVVLMRGDAFHTFRFETPSGRLTGVEQLGDLFLYLRGPKEPPWRVPLAVLVRGGRIPYGNYIASYGNKVEFNPVTVGAQTPEEIVFSAAKGLAYAGRIVHGVTGAPMAGALIMVGNSDSGRIVDLTDDEWQAIHALPASPMMDDKALAPLRKAVKFSCLTRSAADGSWQLSSPPGVPVTNLIVFEQNYLGFKVFVFGRTPAKANGSLQVPEIKLYPSARVTLSVEHPVIPRWMIDPAANAGWCKDIMPWVDWSRRNEGMFTCDGELLTTRSQVAIEVPAGVHLKLLLEPTYLVKDIGDRIVPQDIFLTQGANLDLGRQVLPECIMVGVQVVDEAGTPIEGIPVRLKMGLYWKVPYNTDANGVAYVYVPPGEKVQVGVPERSSLASEIAKQMEIQITGKEPEPPVFVLKVERPLIDRLLAEKK